MSDSSTGSGNSPPSGGLHSSGSPIRSSAPAGHKTGASPREGAAGVKRSHPARDEVELDEMAGAALAAKKQRVSHYKKPDSSQPQQQPPLVQPPVQQQHHGAPYQQPPPPSRGSSSSGSLKSRSSGAYLQQQQQQPPPPRDPYQREQAGHKKQRGHEQFARSEQPNPKDYYRNEARSERPASSAPSRVSPADNPGPETPNSSPESVERMDAMDEPEPYPDYTQLYQRIVSCEQRSRYKEEFNSQYNEYRDLHKIIDRVSKRFAQLEEELRQECEGTSEWQVSEARRVRSSPKCSRVRFPSSVFRLSSRREQRIKDRIVREYKENLRDAKFIETKRRFQHLHEKLAYIKRLVLEWDTAQTCRS